MSRQPDDVFHDKTIIRSVVELAKSINVYETGNALLQFDTESERITGIIDRRSRHRRHHPRAAVTWPVTIAAGKKTLQGRVENISRSGVLVYLNHPLEPGRTVRLIIEVQDCHDFIETTAEVVRVVALKRGEEQQFSHAVGLQFTGITKENLKFFSGNLAPEWEKDYSELESIAQARSPVSGGVGRLGHYVILALAVVLLSSLSHLLIQSLTGKENTTFPLQQLDARTYKIEQQLTSHQSLGKSLTAIENEIAGMQAELARLKTARPSRNLLTPLISRLEDQSKQIEEMSRGVNRQLTAAAVRAAAPPPKIGQRFHIVEKGENLYRISLKTGRTVEQLIELNSLRDKNLIFTGQRLRIE